MPDTVHPEIRSAKAPFYLLQKLEEGEGGYDVAMCADADVLIRYAKASFPGYREFTDKPNGHGYHARGEYVAIKDDHPDHDPKERSESRDIASRIFDQCPSLIVKPVPYVYPALPADERRARLDRIESRID